jgi:hypothetical protein
LYLVQEKEMKGAGPCEVSGGRTLQMRRSRKRLEHVSEKGQVMRMRSGRILGRSMLPGVGCCDHQAILKYSVLASWAA